MPSSLVLRQRVAELAARADADLAPLWLQVRTPLAARDALLDVLPTLVGTYGEAAGALAADWYDELRDEAGVSGRFSAIVASLPDGGGGEALAKWGVSPLFATTPDWAAAQTLVAGGLQRRIANAGRLTVAESSVQDRAARGWRRVGVGRCDFCRLLIDRGAVYKESTASFEAHDHCGCAAEPAFI